MTLDHRGRAWSPAGGVTLDDGQLEAIHTDGSLIIQAGPGAGKTETLAQKVLHLMQTGDCQRPRRILAVTFKRDAARNLELRVKQRLPKNDQGRFDSYTLDAFAKGIVDRFRHALPLDIPLAGYSIGGKTKSPNGPIDATKGSYPAWKAYLTKANPTLDFPAVSRVAAFIISSNPSLRSLLQISYSHLLIDEVQDTQPHQRDLIAVLFSPATSVIAVGDPDQRIMGWAGALSDAFQDFAETFGCQTKVLDRNHRASPALASLQAAVRKALFNNGTGATPAQTAGADCTVAVTGDWETQATVAIAEIGKRLGAGATPRRCAILFRRQDLSHAGPLAARFMNAGIPARLEDEPQDLLSEGYASIVLDTIKVATGSAAEAYQRLRQTMEAIAYSDQSFLRTRSAIDTYVAKARRQCDTYQNNAIWAEQILSFVDGTFTPSRLAWLFPQYQDESWLLQTRNRLKAFMIIGAIKSESAAALAASVAGDGTVPLMSIHKSKGLEFDHVVLLDYDDGPFTSNGTTFQGDERRTAFVGFSRARKSCLVLRSEKRGTTKTAIVAMKPFYDVLELHAPPAKPN